MTPIDDKNKGGERPATPSSPKSQTPKEHRRRSDRYQEASPPPRKAAPPAAQQPAPPEGRPVPRPQPRNLSRPEGAAQRPYQRPASGSQRPAAEVQARPMPRPPQQKPFYRQPLFIGGACALLLLIAALVVFFVLRPTESPDAAITPLPLEEGGALTPTQPPATEQPLSGALDAQETPSPTAQPTQAPTPRPTAQPTEVPEPTVTPAATAVAPTSTPAPTEVPVLYGKTLKGSVNARASTSTGADRVAQLDKDYAFQILETKTVGKDTWYRTEIKGKTAYIRGDLVEIIPEEAARALMPEATEEP